MGGWVRVRAEGGVDGSGRNMMWGVEGRGGGWRVRTGRRGASA